VRVFPDTNVLAAAIAARGLCSELLEIIIHDHELLTCQAVLDELERVLAEKLRLPHRRQSRCVVTGDKELLDLRKAKGLVVVSPRELWLQLLGPELEPRS
jgi:predicted nucleic acid-binding protein